MTLKRLPPLAALQAFLTVARLASFSHAARALAMSQSSISRQITQLENHFRRPLLDRNSRRVALTDAGRRLLPYAERLIELLQQAHRALTPDQDTLTLRGHPTVIARWLLPRLPRFYATHPTLKINLDTAWSRPVDFNVEAVDAMIEFGDAPIGGHEAIKLWHERLQAVCHPKLLTPRTRRSLAGQVLIHSDWQRDEWARWSELTGQSLADCKALHFDSLDLAMTAAEQGQGVALADLAFLGDAASAISLVPIQPTVLDTGMSYHLIYPKATAALPAFRAFRKWLSEQLEETHARLSSPSTHTEQGHPAK